MIENATVQMIQRWPGEGGWHVAPSGDGVQIGAGVWIGDRAQMGVSVRLGDDVQLGGTYWE